MDFIEIQDNIQAFVTQRLAAGETFPTAYDVATRLGLPVSVVDRALRSLNQSGNIEFPYTQSTEF